MTAFVSVGGMVVHSGACTGPASLEARVHAHPDTGAYADLGVWFFENHQTKCAVEAYKSGLTLAPASERLNYLLGSSLYAAGHLEEAVAPLKKAVRLNPQELQVHLLLGAALARLGRGQEAASE